MPSIAILGSGNGSNAQALIDAVEAGTLEATIACIISDVQNARILERAKKHHIPAHLSIAPPPHTPSAIKRKPLSSNSWNTTTSTILF
jgi:folate-dependent phosphoribosylglycinamide formyltransferase PurN